MSKKNNVREPAVAGAFYPANAKELSADIDNYLAKVATSSSERPRAIIVPHAGYFYSAQTATYAYRQLQDFEFHRVIIIGSAHTETFPGVAVDDHDAWETPLGKVEVDKEFIDQLIADSNLVKYRSSAHIKDHVLEVQIPFLQTVLCKFPSREGCPKGGVGNFRIVPLLFGNIDNNYEALAELLARHLGENDLVVISSDLSHYPKANDSKLIDPESLKLIQTGNISALEKHIRESESMIMGEETAMCGADAIKLVMTLAQELKWKAKILNYSNSGDVSGDKTKVVGYGAVVFTASDGKESGRFSTEQKKILLDLARMTVEAYVRTGQILNVPNDDEDLEKTEGAFVTLHRDGKLRGCIGNIISSQPLWDTVQDMAVVAATEDGRFTPVLADELPSIEYEISVLSKPERIKNWQDIELGKHGVIISKGFNKGVFLPQVATETGWDLETFLAHLCSEKAGLPADAYKNDTDVLIEVFTAEVF